MDDPADFDGDGNFDGVDISIIDEDRPSKRPSNNGGGGCGVMLFVLGSAIGVGWYGVCRYLT